MFTSPFTASRWQVSTYLLCVALFSISFLVFLNASVSFVITDLIGQKDHVGDAAGSLGFADELVAIVACPLWGILSDRIGVRNVCLLGYGIIGISLFVFVQARNVYPQLLLARLFFSIGGAAASTMVTAILPAMTFPTGAQTRALKSLRRQQQQQQQQQQHRQHRQHPANGAALHSDPLDHPPPSRASETTEATEATITPARYRAAAAKVPDTLAGKRVMSNRSATSQTAGLVGMFTGLGALVALTLFLPLPARFQNSGSSPAAAITYSFYIVGAIALVVALLCFFGLRGLAGDQGKSFSNLFFVHRSSSGSTKQQPPSHTTFPASTIAPVAPLPPATTPSYPSLITTALKLALTSQPIALGYLGGFVARASSVAITLFIPLYVNAHFIRTGRCTVDGNDPNIPPDSIRDSCRRAYTVAAILGGVSQLVALLCAPLFGWLDGRMRRANAPMVVAAAAGVAGYVALARLGEPDPRERASGGGPGVFAVMALVGVGQIGAIVCSLSSLGRGIAEDGQADGEEKKAGEGYFDSEVGGQAAHGGERTRDEAEGLEGESEDEIVRESTPLLRDAEASEANGEGVARGGGRNDHPNGNFQQQTHAHK